MRAIVGPVAALARRAAAVRPCCAAGTPDRAALRAAHVATLSTAAAGTAAPLTDGAAQAAAAFARPSNLRFDKQTRIMLAGARAAVVPPPPPPMLVDAVVPVACFETGAPLGSGATVTLDARVWGTPLRTDVVHRVVTWQQKKSRTTLYAARTRDNVRGGGRKPWKQKGTGRARAGSIRSPLWRGGGVALGPVHRDWAIALPKRFRRLGLRVALSAKLRDGRLVVVDSLGLGGGDAPAAASAPAAAAAPSGKTRAALATLERNGLTRRAVAIAAAAGAPAAAAAAAAKAKGAPLRVLFLDGAAVPPAFGRAIRNVRALRALPAAAANVLDIVRADVLVATPAAVTAVTAHLLQDFGWAEGPAEGPQEAVAALVTWTATPATEGGSRVNPGSVLSLEQGWPRWQRCWQRGKWRRLEPTAALAKRSWYARGPPPPEAMDNWTWAVQAVDPSCAAFEYKEWDRDAFCRLLRGRSVLLVGDSMTGQFHEALFSLTTRPAGGAVTLPKSPRFPYERPVQSTYTLCGGGGGHLPSRVAHLQNWAKGHVRLRAALPATNISSECYDAAGAPRCRHVRITPGSPEDRVYGVDEFLGEWATAAGAAPPGVVVLNAGAHYQRDAALLQQVRAVLRHVVDAHPGALVVWRDTPPGHAACGNATAPLAAPPTGPLPHNWHRLPGQNDAVRRLIADEFRAYPRVVYMDVATATALRPDLHASAFAVPPDDSDCLHYHFLSPSPVDNWVRALFNVLRLAEAPRQRRRGRRAERS